jgi:hypothetical protein
MQGHRGVIHCLGRESMAQCNAEGPWQVRSECVEVCGLACEWGASCMEECVDTKEADMEGWLP